MGQLTLLLGGARSGKSTLAEKLAAQRGERVLYIATAQALDDEMALRIQKHQQQRPAHWETLETPTGVGAAVETQLAHVDIILLDCLTLLVNNLIMQHTDDFDHPDETVLQEAVDAEISTILETAEAWSVPWIIVSNEVGLGLVPPYPLGRVYRDLLGRANQRLAAEAGETYLMVAGMAIPLHTIALQLDE